MSPAADRVASLRREIEQTRAEMDSTLEATMRRAHPSQVLHDLRAEGTRLLRRHSVIAMAVAAAVGFSVGRRMHRGRG